MKVKITGYWYCCCEKKFWHTAYYEKKYQIFNFDLRVKIIFAGVHNLVLVKSSSIFHFCYQRQILYAKLFDKKILIINKSDFYDNQNFACCQEKWSSLNNLIDALLSPFLSLHENMSKILPLRILCSDRPVNSLGILYEIYNIYTQNPEKS